MNVKMVKTGKTVEVNDCYGTRLIEQGKAVLAPKKKAAEEKQAEKAGKSE